MKLSDAFLSSPPRVRLVKQFTNPLRNAVAAARTCYSAKGIIDEHALGDREKVVSLAGSVFEAGHLTVFQHAHFQFTLENVSRQFLWSFLHSHPFYNSEQVSQRYVAVKPDTVTVPALAGRPLEIYRACLERQFEDYRALCEMLRAVVERAFFERFPRSPSQAKKHELSIAKRAQEIARYVLPVATHAYLYHTVSAVTVFRYWRICRQLDAPTEAYEVARQMKDALLELDPDFSALIDEPLPPDAMPETTWLQQSGDLFTTQARLDGDKAARRFLREFEREFSRRHRTPRANTATTDSHHTEARRDVLRRAQQDLFPGLLDELRAAGFAHPATPSRELPPPEVSRLIEWNRTGEHLLASAVRQTLGLPAATLSDDDAIALALDPARNRLLGETLNLTTAHKLGRALMHPHYTFLKKLSHAADSQDQRHRMVPGSRPFLVAHLTGEPDYVVPPLIAEDEACLARYRESMDRTWESIAELRKLGIADEWAAYLLPGAVHVRFMESGDLLNLRHKHEMRLCFNAQEEIWRASREEALQISAVHPRIGRFLLPPCTMRLRAGAKPYCPEGARYCGVRVWTQDVADYERMI